MYETVFNWYCVIRKKSPIAVFKPLSKQKALGASESLQVNDNRWLVKLRQRCGESAYVIVQLLKVANDIFNANETDYVLIKTYTLMKTLALRNMCAGGESTKEIFTAMFCTNMEEDKKKPSFIGKSS